MNVVLFDVEDRRAWLVDGATALLHLTRTQLASSPCCDSESFKLEDFQHAEGPGGVSGSKTALLNPKNRKLVIFEGTEMSVETKVAQEEIRLGNRGWTYQDMVQGTYHILEQIHDYEARALTCPGANMRLTGREKLTGFAFMDIVS
jgi:hypothetical protein